MDDKNNNNNAMVPQDQNNDVHLQNTSKFRRKAMDPLPVPRSWTEKMQDIGAFLKELALNIALFVLSCGLIVVGIYIVLSVILACSFLGKFMAAPSDTSGLWPVCQPCAVPPPHHTCPPTKGTECPPHQQVSAIRHFNLL